MQTQLVTATLIPVFALRAVRVTALVTLADISRSLPVHELHAYYTSLRVTAEFSLIGDA